MYEQIDETAAHRQPDDVVTVMTVDNLERINFHDASATAEPEDRILPRVRDSASGHRKRGDRSRIARGTKRRIARGAKRRIVRGAKRRIAPGTKSRARGGVRPVRRRRAIAAVRNAYAAGTKDGRSAASHGDRWISAEAALKRRMNDSWTRWWRRQGSPRDIQAILRCGAAYRDGYLQAVGFPGRSWLPVPLTSSASAVVCTSDGTGALYAVLEQLSRLPLEEVVVVLHGGEKESLRLARSNPEAHVVSHPDTFERDADRAVGANVTRSDIVLFVGADTVVTAERLIPFLLAADAGADVVLDDTTPQLGIFRNWSGTAKIQAFLNASFGRNDLRANCVGVLPHALSGRAIRQIGAAVLSEPAKAQAELLHRGLQVKVCSAAGALSWQRSNRSSGEEAGERTKLVAGDHLEAWRHTMSSQGNRLSLPDHNRRRIAATEGEI